MAGKHTDSRFWIWRGMLARCHNPKNPKFGRYGGRGVSVCSRWRGSFEAFCEDVGVRPSKEHEIDRVKNDGNYEPGNVKWSTRQEQVDNSSRVRLLTFKGATLSLTEWSRRSGVSVPTLSGRLRRGWPVDLALTAKPAVGQRVRQRNVAALLTQSTVGRSAFYARLRRGFSDDQAAHVPHHQGQRPQKA